MPFGTIKVILSIARSTAQGEMPDLYDPFCNKLQHNKVNLVNSLLPK
jgi:hypothetical protein